LRNAPTSVGYGRRSGSNAVAADQVGHQSRGVVVTDYSESSKQADNHYDLGRNTNILIFDV
jgi:hypothetical protein